MKPSCPYLIVPMDQSDDPDFVTIYGVFDRQGFPTINWFTLIPHDGKKECPPGQFDVRKLSNWTEPKTPNYGIRERIKATADHIVNILVDAAVRGELEGASKAQGFS